MSKLTLLAKVLPEAGQLARSFAVAAAETKVGGQLLHHSNRGMEFFGNTIKGGILANALGGAWEGLTSFAGGASAGESLKVAISESVPYGDAAKKGLEGDNKGATLNSMTDTAGIAGSLLGGLGGSLLAGRYKFIGMAAGSFLGAVGGKAALDSGSEAILERNPFLVDRTEDGYRATAQFARSAVETTTSSVSAMAMNFADTISAPFSNFVTRNAAASVSGSGQSFGNFGSGPLVIIGQN